MTGNIDAFAAVTNEKILLRPGLGCRARVWLPEIADTLSVPTSAVGDHAGQAIVTVVRDGKGRGRNRIGRATAKGPGSIKGLSAGDVVITAGGYGFRRKGVPCVSYLTWRRQDPAGL